MTTDKVVIAILLGLLGGLAGTFVSAWLWDRWDRRGDRRNKEGE